MELSAKKEKEFLEKIKKSGNSKNRRNLPKRTLTSSKANSRTI